MTNHISMPKNLLSLIAILGIGILILNAPSSIENLIPHSATFTQVEKNKYEANIEKLRVGSYYLTLGKARAFCTIFLDGILIRGASELLTRTKESISVATPVVISSPAKRLQIDCNHAISGFGPRLTHSPILAKLHNGIFIDGLRSAVDIYLGIFASCFLIMLSAYITVFHRSFNSKLWLLCFCSLFYAFNQSYIPRLFFDGDISSLLHTISKALFCWMFLLFFKQSKRSTYIASILSIFSVSYLIYGSSQSGEVLHGNYKYLHLLWATQFAVTFSSLRKTASTDISKVLCAAWTIALIIDTTTLSNSFGPYFAQVFFSVLVVVLATEAATLARRQSEALKFVSSICNSISTDSKPIEQAINEVGVILQQKFRFANYSAYIDTFLYGKESSSSKSLTLISINQGDRPTHLTYADDLGLLIKQAIETKMYMYASGQRDGGWFAIIPIGEYAAICLSNKDHSNYGHLPYFIDCLENLNPATTILETKLNEMTKSLNSSLAKLKKKHEHGIYQTEIGALFIDISDYSKNCEYYGNRYSDFISAELLPSMVKFMNNFATPEVVRGDEIYFVITKDTSTFEGNIDEMTARAIERLHHFVSSSCKMMVTEAGFGPLEYRIGSTTGIGSITIDDVQVRTSGEHINNAKRLQDAATKNEILVSPQLAIASSSIIAISKKTIVVKKNVIEAVKIGIRSGVKKDAA